jgi:hypothetical protein
MILKDIKTLLNKLKAKELINILIGEIASSPWLS